MWIQEINSRHILYIILKRSKNKRIRDWMVQSLKVTKEGQKYEVRRLDQEGSLR